MNQSSSSGAGATIINVPMPAVSANSSTPQNTTITIPAGTYYIWIIADNVTTGAITQSNYADDFQRSADFTVIVVDRPILSVNPANPSIQSSSAGSISLEVRNTGFGSMTYYAAVTSGASWISITSGGAGGNSGTITLGYTTNPDGPRSGTIQITAPGATGSPITVRIAQAGIDGGETVILSGAIAYIRQINDSDMHPAFNSANACGPSSAVMILSYFNRLTPIQ
jgi:hypothetical protein